MQLVNERLLYAKMLKSTVEETVASREVYSMRGERDFKFFYLVPGCATLHPVRSQAPSWAPAVFEEIMARNPSLLHPPNRKLYSEIAIGGFNSIACIPEEV